MSPPKTISEGLKLYLHQIHAREVIPDNRRSISLTNISFPTSYDLGPDKMVVPSAPPVWIPQELPINLPADTASVDPRLSLPGSVPESILRALDVTSPGFAARDLDFIGDRKNLRALFCFFTSGIALHRIDLELVGQTLIFHWGWTAGGYSHRENSYGLSFEDKFTGPYSPGILRHHRVVAYNFGGLRALVKYQVDAYLSTSHSRDPTPLTSVHPWVPSTTSPTGIQIVKHGEVVPPEDVVEIKTLIEGFRPTHHRTLTQLWFSQTPTIIAGYHDGRGHFSSIEKINVKETGDLDAWEIRNTQTLRKVVRLIEMIKEYMSFSPCKKQALVIESSRSGRNGTIKFYELDSSFMGLPDDLRQKWA